jgi:tRNA pseudouridine55 synthase
LLLLLDTLLVPRYSCAMKHGFLLLDKPTEYTSHDCTAVARKTLHERKVGHIGTLDPMATGLMVLAVGTKALKVVELFEKTPKTYIATIQLGATSTTYDAQGHIEHTQLPAGFTVPTRQQIAMLIQQRFAGVITQVPPKYSAIHISGERAYDLARKGIDFVVPTRNVTIEQFTIIDYQYPELTVEIACSSGTYIRSLAHDLGELLHCGGYLTTLRRTQLGAWSVDFAVPLDAIGWSHVLPLTEVLDTLPSAQLTAEQWQAIGYGQTINHSVIYPTVGWFDGYPVVLLEPHKDDPTKTKARKVL